MRLKNIIAAFIAVCGVMSVSAQSWISNFTDGGVYRIICAGKSTQSIAAHGIGQIIVSETTESDNYSQLWQLTFNANKSGVYLRNLNSGAYLAAALGTSEQWSALNVTEPDDSRMLFAIEDQGGNKKFRPLTATNSYGYAHSDASNSIVCWEPSNTNSQWIFSHDESISVADAAAMISEAELLNNMDETEVQTHLDALFADKACTKLKVSNLESNAHYLALPSTLQQMALKINSGDWSEPDWDAPHAQKFRVQLYEPYSRGWESSDMMGVQAYTNMNNPTGIIADNKTAIYVMVEDNIPEGALLTIGGAPGNELYNDYNGQQELHQGVNIVPIWEDHSLLYIYYTVDTWDATNRERKYKLDDFQPVKIHIEGGDINGHFNAIGDELYTPDTNEDWQYYRSRARHDMFDLIGEHIILHFFINNSEQPGEDLRHEFDETVRDYDIPAIIAYWDKIIFYQKMLMGILSDESITNDARSTTIGTTTTWTETLYEPLANDPICPADYHHYINTRMMGLGRNTGYMSGGSWTTNYNANTFHAILTGIVDDDNPGQLWGPAHEHGHVNQQPLKIAGTTEESNNVFSNIAVYYRGINTARTDLPSKQLEVFNSGKTFLENDTWGTTRMFYQLWLYYHAAGHNRKFYPRLFELLRQNPLQKNSNDHLESRYDLLHFAKMCCLAAEEDLTDFFTSWGFFVVQDNYYIDDYSTYYSFLSQEDIDAVKAEIKSYNFPKNTSIIFIDDRPGSNRQSWSDDMAIEDAGTLGGLSDYINNTNSASGSYIFSLDGTTLTIESGNGGAGFLLYDSEGNLIGFSNESTFTLSPEAAEIVANGGAYVEVVNTDNSESAIDDVMEVGTVDQKLSQLNNLIENARELLSTVDQTGRIVGRISPDYALPLENAISEIIEKLDSGVPEDEISGEYRSLAAIYYALLNNDNAYIELIPGAAYNLKNRYYTGRILSTDGQKLTAPVSDELTDPRNQWTLTLVDGTTDTYYIYNEATRRYIGKVNSQSVNIPLTDTPVAFNMEYITREYIAPYPVSEGRSKAIHIDGSGSVVSWNTSENPTQWIFSLALSAEEVEARNRLSELIALNEALIAETGTITLGDAEQIPLQADWLYTNAPYTAQTNNDTFMGLDMLVDGAAATDDNKGSYFHTDYSGNNSTDGLNHYVGINLPEKAVADYDCMSLFYYTRFGSTTRAPQAYNIELSADADRWETYVAPYESAPLTSSAVLNESSILKIIPGLVGVRFVVTKSDLYVGGHYVFALSEIGLNGRTYIATPDTENYPGVQAETLCEARRQGDYATQALASRYATIETLNESYANLNSAYRTLLREINPAHFDLTELIAATEELLNQVGEVPELVENVNLHDGLLSTNAEYTGVTVSDRLNWANLWDGDAATIFHSNYENQETIDGLDHYIQVLIPDEIEQLDRFRFAYTTRNSVNTYAPLEIAIDASTDGSAWTELALFSDVPSTLNTAHELPIIQAPADTRSVRFRVTKSDGTACGHYYFAIGEFALHNMIPSAEPKSEYVDVTASLMNTAFTQMHRADYVLQSAASTSDDYESAYTALLPAYNALYEASQNVGGGTSIHEVNSATDSKPTEIYNLQGRRVSNPRSGQIYIVNGRKMVF